jgi:hypothetical protein
MLPSGAIAATTPGDSAMSCLGTGKNLLSVGAAGITELDTGSSAANKWSIPISDAPELRANTDALISTSIVGGASDDITHEIVTRRCR